MMEWTGSWPEHCTGIVADRGSDHPYALDCLVRHLQQAGWAGAVALGLDPSAEEVVIAAGMGCLRLTPTLTEFAPARRPGEGADQPRPAPPELTAARLAACATCPAWEADRCSVAGCACAGLGQAARLYSRCPLGRWPTA